MMQSSSPPRNILFVVWQYHPVPAGGAEHQARLQAEELVRLGNRVTVVCRRTPGASSGLVNGVQVTRLPAVDRHPFRTVTLLVSLTLHLLISVRRFDLVHVHLAGVYTDFIVLLASLWRVPVYVKIAAGGESGEVRRFSRYARITRYYGLRHAARIQALSEEIARELQSVGVEGHRVLRLPNGVEISPRSREASPDVATLRAELRLPPDATVVVYLGRFSRYKGVADLINAWERAPRPGAHLVLVGYRPEQPPEEQIRPTSDAETITVHDWTRRAADYLAAADVFVLPSHSEGMSNALLEAMAVGLAVISTCVGAAPAMIADGENGLLVPPQDPPALAEALARLLADPDLRKRLGDAAAATIESEYSIGAVVRRIEAEYEKMILERR